MATTLAQLVPSPTKETIRAQLLKQLQGIGFTSLTGYSTGSVTLDGVPGAVYDTRVTIVASGSLGTATFTYSTDGGVTVSSVQTVPLSGTFAIPGSQLVITFTNGTTATGSAFIAGDIFRIQTRLPTLPSTSWQPGSVPLTLVENDAAIMEDVYRLVGAVAAGGLLDTAAGPWLDLLASNVYQLTRTAAVSTLGVVTLTDAASAGPFTITDGQLWFAALSGLRYTNVGTYTLTRGGSLPSMVVKAERPGAAYNVGNNTITTLVTSLPGVTVNNPNPGSGSWITTQGADQESDVAFRTRCRARWPALGTGTPADAYKLWALTADSSITRTNIIVNPSVAGQVLVYLAGSAGPAGGTAVTNANNYIQPRTPLCVTAIVQAATAVPIAVTAQVYVRTAFLASATAQVTSNLTALFGGGVSSLGEVLPGIPIGGTVYVTQVLEMIQEATGVRNVILTSPVLDTVLTATQVATLTQSITFFGV